MYVSNQSPYLDDFDETKKFYRILFRPGRAVQARELTQLQSILQKQIERLGLHIFKEGSIVIPGSQFFEKKYNFVKLQQSYNSINTDSILNNLLNKVIIGQTNGIRAKIVNVVQSNSTDPPTLFVKYLNSGNNGTTFEFDNNEILISEGASPISVITALINSTGLGSAFSISSGVMFIKGAFAYFDSETLIINKYNNQLSNKKIGFKISEEIIDSDDDPSILDPAVGTSNYFAPGADRYKIDFNLEARDLQFDAAINDTNFIELMRIENNEVTFIKPKVEYNILADELARRTFDESGNYSVEPHKIQVLEHLKSSNTINDGFLTLAQGGDDNKYVIKVFPGKSYIKGYEIDKPFNTYIIGDKARNYANVNAGTISIEVGNYVNVTDVHSSPDVLKLDKVSLYDNYVTQKGSVPSTSVLVGTARVRAFEYASGTVANSNSGVYSLFLFDVNLDSKYKFEDHVKSVYYDNSTFEDFTANIVPTLIPLTGTATTTNGSKIITGAGTFFNTEIYSNAIVTIGSNLFKVNTISNNISFTAFNNATESIIGSSIFLNKAEIKENSKQSYIFSLPYEYIREIDPTDTETFYTARRIVDVNLTGGKYDLSSRTDEIFAPYSTDNYKILIKQYGRYEDLSGNKAVPTNNNKTLSIDLSANTNINTDAVRIFATVNKTNRAATHKIKTLQEDYTIDYTTENLVTSSVISLGKADGYRLKSVRMSDTNFGTSYSATNSIDITQRYTFDNGQRLQYYDVCKIILKPNQAKPTGPIRITFSYFVHSSSGDYFNVNSYTDIDYEDIPEITLNGTIYKLRDCLDFRSRIGDDSTFSSSSAIISEFLDRENVFLTDYNYYLPKIDKLILNKTGKFYIIPGISSSTPIEPTTPEDAMSLYVIRQNPYVSNANKDINLVEIDNRRYTMRDIGRLDSRIKNLEYYTSLNLLETQTATLQVQDSFGFDRFKNGFVVDNFTGHGIGDVNNSDYSVSIDYNKRELRPAINQTSKKMFELNTDNTSRSSNNYVRILNRILPSYTEEKFIESSSASRQEFLNPFNVITFKGSLVLDPASDFWFDTIEPPIIVENNFGNYDSLVSSNPTLSLREINNRYNSVYGNWRDFWYGNERTSTKDISDGMVTKASITRTSDVIINSSGNRYEVLETLDNNSNNDKINSKVIIPYMRDKEIFFKAKGMKPNTKLYAFFDDIDVTKFTRISYNRANIIASQTNDTLSNVLVFSDLVTDYLGNLEGTFLYQAKELKLAAGNKLFRLTDSSLNDDSKSTFAEAVYSATGQLYVTNKVLVTGRQGAPAPVAAPVAAPAPAPLPDPPSLGIVNVTLGHNYYNNEVIRSQYAEALDNNGFTVNDIGSLKSSTGFNNLIQASSYLPSGAIDYNQIYTDAFTPGGSILNALVSAGDSGTDTVNYYQATYEVESDYFNADTLSYLIDKISANPGVPLSDLNIPSWPATEVVHHYLNSPADLAALNNNIMANTGKDHITLDEYVTVALQLSAASVVLETMASQDNGVIANTIKTI